MFWLDMLFSINSTIVDDNENIIRSRKLIVLEYLKGWFFIDLVSVFPISFILESSEITSF